MLLSSFLLKPTEVEIYFFVSATALSTCRIYTSTQLLYKKIAKNAKLLLSCITKVKLITSSLASRGSIHDSDKKVIF
jgi:hypothetical protein